jgi:hypothetical protein
MAMLEVHWVGDAEHFPAKVVAIVDDAAGALRTIADLGAYAGTQGAEVADADIRILWGTASGVLLVDSPLLASMPAAIRHLANVIRYQCQQAALPVICRAPRTSQAVDAASDLPQLNAAFLIDATWGPKRLALDIRFRSEIDCNIAVALDSRVQSWGDFSRAGACCTEDQVAGTDEDLELWMEVDQPIVGRDWIEWSIVTRNVPEEALAILVNLMVAFDCREHQIESLSIG